MECKEKLEAYLREQRVPFEVQHHRRAYTAQEVAASEHIPAQRLAKGVLIWADGAMALLVLPASKRVDLTHLGTVLGAAHVRLAHEEELAVAFPDCEVGALPPFGNLYDLPVYVDPALTEEPIIVVPAGTHSDTLSLRYADFARLVEPIVVPFAHPA
jgi:Ala-tRNA(Pro) deacylase